MPENSRGPQKQRAEEAPESIQRLTIGHPALPLQFLTTPQEIFIKGSLRPLRLQEGILQHLLQLHGAALVVTDNHWNNEPGCLCHNRILLLSSRNKTVRETFPLCKNKSLCAWDHRGCQAALLILT